MIEPGDIADLLDWKRQVFALYARIREQQNHAAARDLWVAERDRLFVAHPQSPIPETERARFQGLSYFDYDPAARVLGHVEVAEPETHEIATSDGGTYAFTRYGTVHLTLKGSEVELELYWLEGYGGGTFLPFRDATAGSETYGAGRYLLDTIKGADLGTEDGALVLDFNFAYHPSCAYDPKWVCPLAPPANRVDVPIRAGERLR